jgi:hypothetical protein
MSGLEASHQFWDEKARENPYWCVSSAGPYEGRNLAEFWASGPKISNDLKSSSRYDPRRTDTVVEIGCGLGRLTRDIAHEVGCREVAVGAACAIGRRHSKVVYASYPLSPKRKREPTTLAALSVAVCGELLISPESAIRDTQAQTDLADILSSRPSWR